MECYKSENVVIFAKLEVMCAYNSLFLLLTMPSYVKFLAMPVHLGHAWLPYCPSLHERYRIKMYEQYVWLLGCRLVRYCRACLGGCRMKVADPHINLTGHG
jgi:hypothetical protein